MLRELEHGILNDVQRRFLSADMVQRALEGSLLDLPEEIRKFLFGGQVGSDVCSFAGLRCVGGRIIAKAGANYGI